MHAEFSVINSFVQAAVHHHNSHMLWLFFLQSQTEKSYLFIDYNCTANIIAFN